MNHTSILHDLTHQADRQSVLSKLGRHNQVLCHYSKTIHSTHNHTELGPIVAKKVPEGIYLLDPSLPFFFSGHLPEHLQPAMAVANS